MHVIRIIGVFENFGTYSLSSIVNLLKMNILALAPMNDRFDASRQNYTTEANAIFRDWKRMKRACLRSADD